MAILDWDMCTTGDRLTDLGYLLNVWTEAGDDPAWRVTAAMPTWRDGCLTRAEAVERYRRLTGFDVGDATWTTRSARSSTRSSSSRSTSAGAAARPTIAASPPWAARSRR